jgi:hypothetical protein
MSCKDGAHGMTPTSKQAQQLQPGAKRQGMLQMDAAPSQHLTVAWWQPQWQKLASRIFVSPKLVNSKRSRYENWTHWTPSVRWRALHLWLGGGVPASRSEDVNRSLLHDSKGLWSDAVAGSEADATERRQLRQSLDRKNLALNERNALVC